MADPGRLAQDAIAQASRVLRHLPGRPGGLGTYFATQRRLERSPAHPAWHGDVDRLLGLADRSLARGRIGAALSWFDKALRLSYHGSLHQAGASPLAADPDGFLHPLRSSAVGRILIDGTVDPTTAPAPPPVRERAADAPVRLLILAQENWTFVRPVIDALRARGGFEIREIDVDELPAPGFADRDRILRGRYDAVTDGRLMPTPPALAEAYEWADVVLIEWCHHLLTWITLLDRAPRALMARLHRFEAFTPFALLHDYRRLDRLLYVSPPVHSMLETVAPAAAAVPATRVGNLLQRGLGPEPDGPGDPHLLVQVGWMRQVKDVLFSLEVIEALRTRDPRYRLRLIGPGLPARESHDTPYQRRVRRRLEAAGPEAVEQLGVREDVPALLSEAGIILSSSRHEGTHESVMEGLAAGCAAVVRDWPDTLGYGGAASVYGPRWVVADVAEAVERILDLQDPETLARAGRDARQFALEHRGPDLVVDGYARALTPEGA